MKEGVEHNGWFVISYASSMWYELNLFVYPLSTWCSHMWPDLPGLSFHICHTASNQILEVGMVWERGYLLSC